MPDAQGRKQVRPHSGLALPVVGMGQSLAWAQGKPQKQYSWLLGHREGPLKYPPLRMVPPMQSSPTPQSVRCVEAVQGA